MSYVNNNLLVALWVKPLMDLDLELCVSYLLESSLKVNTARAEHGSPIFA